MQRHRKVYIRVVSEAEPYLRPHADGKWNDNLLVLTECNGTWKLVV
jgi:hypothetical protein